MSAKIYYIDDYRAERIRKDFSKYLGLTVNKNYIKSALKRIKESKKKFAEKRQSRNCQYKED